MKYKQGIKNDFDDLCASKYKSMLRCSDTKGQKY